MLNAGNTLKTLAQNGSFAVNKAGFQACLKACDFFTQRFPEINSQLQILSQKAGMVNITVAQGRDDSMLPNIQCMNEAVEAARATVGPAAQRKRLPVRRTVRCRTRQKLPCR